MPVSTLEMAWTFFCIVCGLFLFAVIVGGLGEVMQAATFHQSQFRSRMDAVNMFMNYR